MIIPEIATTVNSDPDTTLNDLLYIMDYKQYGESSGVYQNKDALQKALMTWYAVNDTALRKEAVVSANSNDRVGELLAKQYGVNLPQLKQYTTLDAIKRSTDKAVLDELYLTGGKLRWLFSSDILDDDFFTAANSKVYFDDGELNIVSAVAAAYYNGYKDATPLTYNGAKSVQDKGSVWWTPFDNQTWLDDLYAALSEQHDVQTRSVSGTVNSSNNGSASDSPVAGISAVISIYARRYLGGTGSIVTNRIYNSSGEMIGSVSTNSTDYTSAVSKYVFIQTESAYQAVSPNSGSGSGWYTNGSYTYF